MTPGSNNPTFDTAIRRALDRLEGHGFFECDAEDRELAVAIVRQELHPFVERRASRPQEESK